MHNTVIDSAVPSYTLDEKKFSCHINFFLTLQGKPQLFGNKAAPFGVYKKIISNEKHNTNTPSITMISRAGLRHAAVRQQSPPKTASSSPSSGSFHA